MTQENPENQEHNTTQKFDESYVKELRQEAANYRTKLRDAESQLEQLQQEKQQFEEEMLNRDIEMAAKEAGVVDPQTAAKLIDKDSAKEGGRENIQQQLNQLVQEKPFLKGGDIGRPSNPGDNGQPKMYSRQEIEQMSPEEINADWENISEQMQKGLIR